jgi:hypothetical protein
VPDFAATLTTQAEQDANDRNVDFLRSRDSYSRRRPLYLSPAEFDQPPARDHIEIEAQRRMRRALLHRRRYTPAQLQEIDRQNETSPAVRAALRQPVSYQGWAPGGSDTEVEDEETTRTRTTIQRQDTDDRGFGPVWRRLQRMQSEQMELQLRDSRLNSSGQSHFVEDGSGEPTTTDASLRTTALLQSIRRSANRFPPRSLSPNSLYRLQLSILEDQDGAPLTRQRNNESTSLRPLDLPDQDTPRTRITPREPRTRTTDPPNQSEVSHWLEEAIKYLERLRYCDTHSERMSSAADSPFLQGEYFMPDLGDFLIDTTIIDPPPQSSWLRVGGVFSGSQHASGGCGLPTYQVTSSRTRRTTSGRHPTLSGSASLSTRLPTTSSAPLRSLISSAPDSGDSWPVKVTINSVDYSTMTLSGTMEAFNVPRKSLPPAEASITTFLEGEIIDFNRYTLETKSFSAGADIDSTYWRKLEPFKELGGEEIARKLVSVRWLREELGKKWILMRWKGKFLASEKAESHGGLEC